ncbi:hypothetical protein [Prosthecobacter sp.]|uniref:hypothetical protein n=1 Tax=Prosthecobacter sp. TaxID=1965333 RepID=UPI00378358B7
MDLKAYETVVRGWSTAGAVDWDLVSSMLADSLCNTIRHFSLAAPNKEIYGIVIERTQSWNACVHLNTEEGLIKGPSIFRPGTRGYEHMTDEEIRESLGRWYYEAWEFQLYEYVALPEIRGLNRLHYDLFEKLFSEQCDRAEPAKEPELTDLFLQSVARATALLEQSKELQQLSKTPDFRLRLFDGGRHEWETDEIMTGARASIGAGS